MDGADSHAALRALRQARQRKRLVSLEWFELAYKVYVAGLIVGGAVVLLAHLIGDQALAPDQLAHLWTYGPSVVGTVMAVALGLGLRSGARGGPLSVESADVTHLLLAPVPRRAVLLRPAAQQLRLGAFAGAGTGAVAGLLLARRLAASLAGWIASGAAAGATVGVAFVAAGLVAHRVRLRQWQASLLAAGLVGWQAASIPTRSKVPGPFDTVGELALWAHRGHVVDILAPILVAALGALGVAGLERFSIDALARRSALVTQLRFAVTLRDLRTVVLLRRQLSNEQHRLDPWVAVRPVRSAVIGRGLYSLARFPASRVARMVLLVGVAAAAQVAAYRGTTPAIVVSGLASFVLGLECLEPFAQEIDQPDRCDGLPHPRGWLLLRHLPVPAAVAALFGVLGAGGTVAVLRTSLSWQIALVVFLPVVGGGLAGAVLNVMSGIPEPVTPGSVNELLPPEVAGLREIYRTVRPLAVAVAGSLPILAARAAARHGDQPVPPALQATVAVGIMIAVVAWWARRREDIRRKFKGLWAAGDAEFAARQRAKLGGAK